MFMEQPCYTNRKIPKVSVELIFSKLNFAMGWPNLFCGTNFVIIYNTRFEKNCGINFPDDHNL